MRQILCNQHRADVLAINGQAPAWPPVVALLGPFGAAWTRAGDDLQIDFVGPADDLAQPGGGASSQCSFARTLRALAFFGGIEPDESDALALLVDHVAFKDINILGRNWLGIRRCYGEQQRDRAQMDIHDAAPEGAGTRPRGSGVEQGYNERWKLSIKLPTTSSTRRPRQYTSSQGHTGRSQFGLSPTWLPRHCCKRAIPDNHNTLIPRGLHALHSA
jgi:hypothetical protein